MSKSKAELENEYRYYCLRALIFNEDTEEKRRNLLEQIEQAEV